MRHQSSLNGKLKTAHGYSWPMMLALILILAGGFIYGRLTTGHNWGDDFAGYIGQAKSIVEGNVDGYLQQNAFTIMNSRPQIGPVAYPWGYPLLLAAIYPACGLDMFCLKLLNIPVYLLFLLTLFPMLTRYLTKTESLLITGLFAINPAILDFQDNILSDIPFMLFSTLAMWLLDYTLFDESPRNNVVCSTILGAALYLAFSVRASGILIVGTFFAAQSLQILLRFLKTRIFFVSPQILIPYVVFGTLYLISNALLPGTTGTYFSQLHVSWKVILYNLWYYQSRSFYFFNSLPAFQPLSWVLLGLAITGMLLTLQRNYHFAIYTLATLGLYVVWPFPSPRFLFGIAPFLVYFVYYPIRFALGPLKLPGNLHWVTLLPVTLLLASGMYFGWTSVIIVRNNLLNDRVLGEGPFTTQSAGLFAFIREQTLPDSRIIFFKPRIMTLLTGRPAWTINRCDHVDDGDFVAFPRDAKYSKLNLDTIESCNPGTNFEIVFENDSFIVYQGKN